MRSETIRIYCCETYDKTRDTANCKKSFHLFGDETQRNTQRGIIKKYMNKRNLLYRNEIPFNELDKQIEEFKQDVEDIRTKQPIKEDILPLKESRTAPDFHLDQGTGNNILICGSGKRGKSHLLKKIWEKYYKDNNKIITILISPSVHIPLYQDMKGSGVIKINKFNKSTNNIIRDIKRIQCKTKNSYEFLILLDDIINMRYSEVCNELVLLLRNSLISSIISCQYPMMLSKMARSSVNNVCSFGLNTDEACEAMLLFFGNELNKITGLKKEALIGEFCRLCQMGDHHSFLKYRPLTRELEHCLLKL